MRLQFAPLSFLLALLAVAVAPQAARAQIDALWSGPLICDRPPAWANVQPLQHDLVVDIAGGVMRLDGGRSGGSMIANRTVVRQDGTVTLRGTDRHGGGEWEFRLNGLIRGNVMSGAGEYSRWEGGRSLTLNCRFTLTRGGWTQQAQPQPQPQPQPKPTPPPQPPQAQPKPPAPLPPLPTPPKDPQQANIPLPNAQEVEEIFRKACAGDRDAQFRAGELNEKGLGVRKSLVEAYRWYDLSQANGNLKGAPARNAVESLMSRDEASEARKPRQPGEPPCTQMASGPTAPPPAALYKAAEAGNLAEVKRLLQANADPNAANADGRTPLMAAAAGGHNDVVKALLEAGANANAQSRKGETALMLGAGNGGLPTVQALLDANADPLLRDGANKDALEYAQRPQVRELLADVIAKAIEAKLNLTDEQRRKIQTALTGIGFDTRGASGQFTNETRQAIKAWQIATNERPTSYLTQPQAERLLRINAGAPGGSQEVVAKWLGTWVGNATFSYSGNVPDGNQTCRGEAVENIGITIYPGASPTDVVVNLFGSRSVKDTRTGGDGQALVDGRTSIMIPGMVEYATGTERRNAQGQPVGQLQSQRQLVKYEVQRAELLFGGKALRLTLSAQPVDPNQRTVPVGSGWVERQYFYLDQGDQRVVFIGPGLGVPDGTNESAAVQRQIEDNLAAIARNREVDNGKPSKACSLRPSAVTILGRK